MDCLKDRFSGPCSWMIVAACTADWRDEWMTRRLLDIRPAMETDDDAEGAGKYNGRTDWMCSSRSGRGSYTETCAEVYVRCKARKEIPMAPRPMRQMCSFECGRSPDVDDVRFVVDVWS